MITSNVRILRLNSIVIKTGIARSTIYDWLNPKSPRYDSSFPKPRKLGKQSVGWLESEIDGWINERAQASNEA
ncbi:AlpA family phage regulatory protein [Klebsiella pneumoniae]|uniref:DNA-binding transcriptional activator AlpA n=1 Tax=Gibbsiella dentisursi TaxID=796890 RepID=A0ABP7LVJ3_9GAMM|nr:MULTISPECIES: AlpA family phage regulatory protein [Enterobacteriaceae]ELY3740714.1 AlpA family phage regulatory protein [Cronobacter sakazakii]MBT1840203.1 AlpA family phage regulatory protein [Enterobacter hormaechei subsp. xiangfangensis]MCA4932687.1 AlpA family phage regulatory protein [Klebsiella pneumoniae]HDT1602813.1 AlpA family phage regulatory protein [Enterobacter sichuanensis]HDX8698001.1 AlpA family phage regulatory protein [Klebsiella oxytoca]